MLNVLVGKYISSQVLFGIKICQAFKANSVVLARKYFFLQFPAPSWNSNRANIMSRLYSNFTTDATQYGIESEAKAVTLYMREMEKNGIDVTFEEIGLLVSKDKPYLGASIDRIVTIKDTHEKWGMEIKSPLSKAGMTIEEACQNKTFFLEKLADGTVRLRRKHDYYVQTQGQLYCSNLDLKGIILVVYFGESRPLFVEKIYLDNSWISDSLPKIDFFYRRALFPELITRRVQRGKILYLHGGWCHMANIVAQVLV